VGYSRGAERPLLLPALPFAGRKRAAPGRQAQHPPVPAERGRVGGRVGGGPVLLLTTTGRKSGQARTAPVLYLADGERFVVINTNAGNAKTPAWSLNLRADPEAEVEVGRKQLKVRARIAEGEERTDLWRRHMQQYSGWDYYESKLDRDPVVFVLEPR